MMNAPTPAEWRLTGRVLIGASVGTAVALCSPIWAVFSGDSLQQAQSIADRVPLYIATNALWIAVFVAGAAGVGMLGALVARSLPHGSAIRLGAASVAPLFGSAMLGYVASEAIDTPTLTSVALRSAPASTLEPALRISHALWTTSSWFAIAATALLTCLVGASRLLPRRAPIALATWTLVAAAALAATGELPPFALFLLALPWVGAAALVRARRPSEADDRTATGSSASDSAALPPDAESVR